MTLTVRLTQAPAHSVMLSTRQNVFTFAREVSRQGRISQILTRLPSTGLCGLLPAQHVTAQSVPLPVANPSFEGSYAALNECANITGVVAPDWADNTCWDTNHLVIIYARDNVSPHSETAAQKITLVSGARVQFAQFRVIPERLGCYLEFRSPKSARP